MRSVRALAPSLLRSLEVSLFSVVGENDGKRALA